MKLTKIADWFRSLPRSAVIAAAVLLAVMILLPFLLLLPGHDGESTDTPSGVLRNPTDTGTHTADPDTTVSPDVPAFMPMTGDFVLSVPQQTDSAAQASAIYALPTGTAVLLSTEKSLSQEQISTLSVTPETPITVEASDTGYLITPTEGDWEEDTLYRLSMDGVDGYLAAFQTHRAFAVTSVYPAHESTGVPTDTGIEITFSDTVRTTDLASYITVSPAIDGRFEIYPSGRTAVIIPDAPLEPDTQYTVTVKAGMPSDNGTTLSDGRVFGFYTMRFTSDYTDFRFHVDSQLLTSPGQIPVLSYNAYLYDHSEQMTGGVTVEGTAYAFTDADTLQQMLLDTMNEKRNPLDADVLLPTDGLISVWEGTAEKVIESGWSNGENGWLYLPTLEEGIYLVELRAKAGQIGFGFEDTVQLLWQVTPMRAYTEHVSLADGTDTLFWIHRTDTGNPTAAALDITLFDNGGWYADGAFPTPQHTQLTADDNGIAHLLTDGTQTTALVCLRDDGHSLLLCTDIQSRPQEEIYHSYLYTDRAVYFPNDTVSFWGVLGRTYPTQTLPASLSLSVAGCDTGTRITVAPDGSFSGSFPIEDWISSSISFVLTEDDGKTELFRSLRVTQQEKPLYTLSVDYDRPFYTLDDRTAKVTMSLAYFDGTPAPGMTLSVYTDQKQETVRTDENGQAVFSYTMPEGDYRDTSPIYSEVSVQLSGYETVSLYTYAQTYYFHSSGVMTAERIDRDQSRVRLHHLDTSRIETTEDIYGYPDGYPTLVQGAPMNTQVTVTLEKNYYIKTKSGRTSYDPINKVTVEHYDYQMMTETVKTYGADVTGGELILDHIDTAGEECSYYYLVSWRDPVCGRTYTVHVNANRGSRNYSPYGDNSPKYALHADRNSALPGERVNLSLLYDDEPAVFDGVQVLYTRHSAGDGRADIAVGNQNTYSYTFDEACTLGCEVYATVFDGEKYITNLSHLSVYDHERGSTAEMTVSADRDTYRPGECATVTVSAPDLAGGTVLVSVVDEACFALGEHSTNTADFFNLSQSRWGILHYRLPTILRDSRISLLSVLQGHLPNRGLSDNFYSDDLKAEVEEAPAAPATGGAQKTDDPAYVREQFLNTAAFVTVTLDENGIGTAVITVPDNITTWRLTSLGFSGTGMLGGEDYTSGVRCGTAVSDAVCTLPLFLNITMPDLFLTRDEISFSARTAGTVRAADPTAQIRYTAVLYSETDEVLGESSAAAAANEEAWFSFGTLAAGEYSVVVTGICGEYSDAVRTTFCVTDTAQIVPVQKLISPDAIAELSPAAFPLTLTFCDGTDTLYHETMTRLAHSGYARTDAKAAAYAALISEDVIFGDVRTWYSPTDMAETIRRELAQNYWGYGFLPLTQYAEGDPILTAEVLYAAPTLLGAEHRARLVTEYETYLENNTAEDVPTAAALLALVCLDRPVLDLLYGAAQYADTMSERAILYLSAAFAAIGDTGAARALWEPLRDTWGQSEDGDAFCIIGYDTEDTISLTALALLPASIIDCDTACAMVRYLENHTSSVDLHVLELAAFVTHYRPTSAEQTHLSYRTRGGEQQITLSRGQLHTLTLTASDFRAFELLSADSGIVVRAGYGASPSDAMMKQDSTLTVHKTVTPYDAENGIYRVTLTFEGSSDADHLQYAVTDTIPAGARYFIASRSDTGSYNCGIYLSNRGGQQVKGTLSVYNPTLYDKYPLDGTQSYSFSATASYLIRGAVKGTFTVEPTLAINDTLGTYAMSEGLTVTIDDGAWEIK